MDFSGLETIVGADPSTWSNDDWLAFSAATASAIKFGNASVTRRTAFTATGLGTRFDFVPASTCVRRPRSTSTPAPCSTSRATSCSRTRTRTALWSRGRRLQMDGAQPQVLEVGGKNLGPTGASSRNFGLQPARHRVTATRLASSGFRMPSTNGQRGPSGESEALLSLRPGRTGPAPAQKLEAHLQQRAGLRPPRRPNAACSPTLSHPPPTRSPSMAASSPTPLGLRC